MYVGNSTTVEILSIAVGGESAQEDQADNTPPPEVTTYTYLQYQSDASYNAHTQNNLCCLCVTHPFVFVCRATLFVSTCLYK